MLAMVKRQLYCPRISEVVVKPCPKPPKKESIIEAINFEIENFHGIKLRWDMKVADSPPVHYLLNVLATLNPEHRFFCKSFAPDDSEIPYYEKKLTALKSDETMQHKLFKDLPIGLVMSRKKFNDFPVSMMKESEDSEPETMQMRQTKDLQS